MASGIGPIVFDVLGCELSGEEMELLQHPLVGGVIYFARNFESAEQIEELSKNIRKIRKKPLLITVDQEGGRVQRFREGFTRLPSMGQVGQLFDESEERGLKLATTCGWLMAAELLAVGVDLSFAPVLDIDHGISAAIGNRAFHQKTSGVITLAKALVEGMQKAGMAAVGKHFPGHGSVNVDSHLDLPVDKREFDVISEEDLMPFVEMIKTGIQGVMAAHILFPAVDDKPVGFSSYWLKNILRKRLDFNGLIFSDDLDMKGAAIAGDFPERAEAALDAGCDMALICNNRPGVIKTLDGLSQQRYLVESPRFSALQAQFSVMRDQLKLSALWKEKSNIFNKLMEEHHFIS